MYKTPVWNKSEPSAWVKVEGKKPREREAVEMMEREGTDGDVVLPWETSRWKNELCS